MRGDQTCFWAIEIYTQDEDYQVSCKLCPNGGRDGVIGLRDVRRCYHLSHWVKHTDFLSVLAVLISIVTTATVLLAFRNQVRHEPDGLGAERYEKDIYSNVDMKQLQLREGRGKYTNMTMVPEVGSGDDWGSRKSLSDLTSSLKIDTHIDVAKKVQVTATQRELKTISLRKKTLEPTRPIVQTTAAIRSSLPQPKHGQIRRPTVLAAKRLYAEFTESPALKSANVINNEFRGYARNILLGKPKDSPSHSSNST